MYTNVFDNIDLLVNMADSELNVDDVNTELITTNNAIKEKQNKISELENNMGDARYINEANKLVDRNIEMSLKNKINYLNNKLKDMDNANIEVKNREKAIYKDISHLKEQIKESNEYLNVLKKQGNLGSFYADIVNKEESNSEELSKILKEKEDLYQSILQEIELNNQANGEIKSKLNILSNRLEDVRDNLNNPKAYLDSELKKEDENKLNNLKEELNNLEKKKLELLTNASLIGSDAKELIVKGDIKGAINKIKELVTIVKAKPYMDEYNIQVLEEELEKKENKRNEIATIINTKNYEEEDNSLINKRIEYLNKLKDLDKDKINEYNKAIENIEKIINEELSVEINELESNILILEQTITKYRDLIKNKGKNYKERANLENVLTKKERQRIILNDLLKGYKDNLMKDIEEIDNLNNLKNNLVKEQEDIEKELEGLNKLVLLDFKVNDFILEEEDKEKLNKVNEEIKCLKNRLKYKQNASEIYDEIDMALGTLKQEEINEDINTNKIDDEVLNIDKVIEPEKLKVIDIIPVGGQNGA